MYNELTENWSELKSGLLTGLTESQKEIVSPLLENQKKVILNETAHPGATQASDIANFRKTLLPMVRRIIPGTIATELVGVQPMSGPVGLAYTLRYGFAEDMQHDPTRSVFGGYDINAGDEAFGNDPLLRQFYSSTIGSGVSLGASGLGPATPGDIAAATAQGTAWGAPAGTAPAFRDGADVRTYHIGEMDFGSYQVPVGGSMLGGGGGHLEGSGGRKMTLKVLSQAVEAGSRKLQAGWTIEAMQDLNSQHGLDLESEMTKALSAEIVQEIDSEIIQDLLQLAGTVRTFDFAGTSGPTYAPAWVGDRYSHLAVYINEIANEIARKTRRGAANYIVVSPVIVSILQSAAKAVFAPAIEGSFKGPNNTQLVGTLNGTIKVYSYIWNAEQLGSTAGQRILVGYKGGNGETDAGYFYCPYIPLMSSGVVINPDSYTPSVSLMTRYAKLAFTDPTTSLGNSADYYGRLQVNNLSAS